MPKTTEPRASLAVLKLRAPSASRVRISPREKEIAALEDELARTSSPELRKLAKRELAIKKNRERSRHRLRKQYADPSTFAAYTPHEDSTPRASLALLIPEPPRKETTVTKTTTTPKTNLRALKANPDKGNEPTTRDLIKAAHKSGGTSLHLPERLRKVKK